MFHRLYPIVILLTALILVSVYIFPLSVQSAGGRKGKPAPPPPPPDSTPMSLEYDRYHFRDLSGDNSCLGEDDWLEWKATGALESGESFSFTPQVPACTGTFAIFVVLSWEGSQVELSTVVPDDDYTSLDPSQQGLSIVAPSIGNTSQLCMFPSYDAIGLDYKITVTNVGAATAYNVVLDGGSDNDWPIFYHHRCLQADADGDGWNDSFEHTMAQLLYPLRDSNNPNVPETLWGTNYLRVYTASDEPDNEVDTYPLDVNDDGRVNEADTAMIESYKDQGNGVPLENISPNASAGDAWIHNNYQPWRRYDLDADGYVSQTDIDIVTNIITAFEDVPIPLPTDIILPTARVLVPAAGDVVARNSSYRIEGHAWDNAALTQVDYVVDGNTVCSRTNPVATFYYCWWNTPKKRGAYAITMRAYDAAGNMGTSDSVTVMVE